MLILKLLTPLANHNLQANSQIFFIESKVTFVVKLLDENWQYRLVYSHSQRHMNLSRRLTDAVRVAFC